MFIKVFVGGVDIEYVVFCGEFVLNILELLSVLESICGYIKGVDLSVVFNFFFFGSCFGSILKIVIFLVSVNDFLVGMCKNFFVVFVFIEGVRLCDVGLIYFFGFLM